MKPKLLLLFFSIILTASAFGQTDKIYLHSDTVIEVHIQNVLPHTITYTYHGAKGSKTAVSKHAVRKIIYSDNREAEISPFIVVKSTDDWEKVVILNDISETAGLQYAGEVSGTGGGKFVDSAHAEIESLMLLKKAAAKLRCPFVYIAENHVRNVGFIGRRVRKSRVAYKY